MIQVDEATVEAARQGNRAALEELVGALQRPMFNLALRMLADSADAEDAAQEIVIKILTHLGGLRDLGAFGGWALRVATRHLIQERTKGRIESMRLTFRSFGADLMDGLADLPDDAAVDPQRNALAAQVKIGCTLALLTCLSRPLRAAYVLADVYELSDLEAAEVLEIAPAAYRQRLRRARAMVVAFTQRHCGLVAAEAPCRCVRRVDRALATGRIQADAGTPEATHELARIERSVACLDRDRRTAALLRSNPAFSWQARTLEVLDRFQAGARRFQESPGRRETHGE